MDNIKELITNSLNFYDTNKLKYDKIFDKVIYYSLLISNADISHNIIIFYDKDKTELFRSRYELVGEFIPKLNIWTWGWAIPTELKNKTFISKKLFDYAFDITAEENLLELKLELMTPRIITNQIQLDIHLAIASYISKTAVIHKIIEQEGILDPTQIIKVLKTPLNQPSEYFTYLYLFDVDNIKLHPDNI